MAPVTGAIGDATPTAAPTNTFNITRLTTLLYDNRFLLLDVVVVFEYNVNVVVLVRCCRHIT